MSLIAVEHTFSTFDKTELFYRAWHPGNLPQSRALVLFHGGHEHSGRFQDLIDQLSLHRISVFAWDARGHGLSPGKRGYARHYMDVVRDADAFIRHITNHHHIEKDNMVVMGHSVGSVTLATWIHDYAPNIKGAVLGAPAFDIKLYVPLAIPGLKLLQKIKPDAFITSYVKPGMLTHDAQEVEERATDELISPNIAVRVLTSLSDTARRVMRDAHTIKVPVLVLSAGKDWVVKRGAQELFIERTGSAEKELSVYPGFFHEIYHEAERARPIARARTFIQWCFDHTQDQPLTNERESDNAAVYQSLKHALPYTSWKKYYFGATALILKHIGPVISKGLKTGWEHGFDSGTMLNYVYENQANGLSPIGKFCDRLYLDSPGWAGIRQRNFHLQTLLTESISSCKQSQDHVHVMDVAAGPGKYVLDVLSATPDDSVTATCQDISEFAVEQGRAQVRLRNLQHQVVFTHADAFNLEPVDSSSRTPHIVIVSGLYELFDDDELVLKSLQGIYNRLASNGILIYTNQPWHPQLELIARTLIKQNKKPWVMRPRSQNEMNGLVEAAGFKLKQMLIDDAGIFTVSTAIKPV